MPIHIARESKEPSDCFSMRSFTQQWKLVVRSVVILFTVGTTSQAFVQWKPLDLPILSCVADPWRMVWADSHLLLCKAELRPRTEHDRKPHEGVLTWRTAPYLPSALSSRDPASCVESASHRPAPPQAALHRRCSAPRPGGICCCIPLEFPDRITTPRER